MGRTQRHSSVFRGFCLKNARSIIADLISMTIFIDLIPSDGLTQKQFELLSLCAAPHRIDLDNPPPESLLMTVDAEWLLLMHWLYKKGWVKNHTLPWMRKEKSKALSLEGEVWWQLLRLCRGVRDTLESEGKILGSAFDRWVSILLKFRLLELKKLYNPADCSGLQGRKIDNCPGLKSGNPEDCPKLKRGKTKKCSALKSGNHNKCPALEGGKRALKSIYHGKLKLLGNRTNPSNPFNRETNPQLYSLIQEALRLEGKYSVFREDYWEPFLNACREWTENLDHKGTIAVWAEKDEKTGEWVWYQRAPEADRGKQKISSSKSVAVTPTA